MTKDMNIFYCNQSNQPASAFYGIDLPVFGSNETIGGKSPPY